MTGIYIYIIFDKPDNVVSRNSIIVDILYWVEYHRMMRDYHVSFQDFSLVDYLIGYLHGNQYCPDLGAFKFYLESGIVPWFLGI